MDPQAAEDPGRGGLSPGLTILGFAFLTYNSGMAIYRSQGDAQSVAFVAFSYVDLVLLFACLRSYEREPACYGSKRRWLKMAVWSLTTLLTLAFSYKVAAVMPLPVAAVVWAMAFATFKGAYYAFFLHRESTTTSGPQNIGDSVV